jgi:hypothetical protein
MLYLGIDQHKRQLTVLRARLIKNRTAVLNSIHKILRKHNLEQPCPTRIETGTQLVSGSKRGRS